MTILGDLWKNKQIFSGLAPKTPYVCSGFIEFAVKRLNMFYTRI
jgi:hypothetical protein